MALLWIEGFEGYGTTTNNRPLPAGVMARKYSNAVNESNMDIETGRVAGYCIELPGGSWLGTPSLTTDDTLICGFAFRTDDAGDYTLMAFWDGGSKNFNLRYESAANELDIWRDNTLIATSSGLGILANTWYWVEMKAKTHNTLGTYDVELNGASVFSATNVDTQAGSNAWSDNIRFFGAGTNNRWDDIYVCDTTGSVNNDMLGNVRVVSISPDGDDTANFGTSTPNASHYANVDENPTDDDTSYVEDGTVNTTDLYDYAALSGSGSILGLQINTQCRQTDVTAFSLITPIESNGSQYDDSAQSVGTTSYVTKYRISETDPDTSTAWTIAGVNAAKFGIKVA
jgi:hypothetical protein